ncbi:MAG: TonB-dependent receptor [Bryobacteraceae bacterium]|nr:TonB-dependent receptor [Bryobacteraceae bacterium]
MLFTLRLAVAVGFLAASSSLLAQTGRISGSVVDAQGAAVPGATINLFLRGSAAALSVSETSAAGLFQFNGLQPVLYDLEVFSPGFRKEIIRGLKVDSNTELAVQPVKLEVSASAEVVEVSADAVAIQTANAEITTTISNEQLRKLPTLNRSPLGLISTQAGVGSNSRTPTTINGMRPSFTNITLEGINIQDNYIRTNALDFLPNLLLLDQIAEMTLSTSNTNAGLGNGAAQISFSVPSGTNTWHGALFWSNRNNYFAGNTWFNNRNNVATPFLNQNQAGGSLGGRIIKDKLFFYSNYELFRLRQQSSQTRTILREDARKGILTYNDTSSVRRQINLLQLTNTAQDAAMQRVLAQIPGPEKINRNDIGDGLNTGGFAFVARNNRTRDNLTTKIDYVASTKHSFSGVYAWNRDLLDRPADANNYSVDPGIRNDNSTPLFSATWRWAPKANVTNEFRGGFNLAPGLFLTDQDYGNGIFTLPLVSNPVNTFRPQGRYTDTYNLANNANWFKNKHNLSFGVQYQRISAEPFNDAANLPTWTVGMSAANSRTLTTAQIPGLRSTDLGIANGLLALQGGFISSATQTFNATSRTSGFVPGATNARRFSMQNWALYLNDQWKVTPRLTVTLGVRWEYFTPVNEKDSLMLTPVLQNGNAITTLLSNGTLDFAGNSAGRPFYKSDWNNFGPNVGLSWQPFSGGKTVIRAGYSVNYPNDEFIRSIYNSVGTNDGLAQTVTMPNLVDVASRPTVLATPAFKVPRTFADNYATNTSAAFATVDPSLATPYVQQWNFGIQREIAKGVFEVRYVGNHATKQFRAFDLNQIVIKDNGFLDDFRKAQRNADLSMASTRVFNPAYNPAIAGSQPLPVFDRTSSGGNLGNAAVRNYIQTGEAGELANFYMINRVNGGVQFYRNPLALGTNLMTNYSNASYNALQVDYRRTIRDASVQVNYTWAKSLSDAAGDAQTRFEPFLDNENAAIERAPTPFDLRHAFKVNGAYLLPVGSGKLLNTGSGVLERIFGGWTATGNFTWQTGSPFSILSGRGTLNRAARSASNTASTSLTGDQLDEIVKFQMTGNGPIMIDRNAVGTDGRAVAADGSAAFSGQVFFQPTSGGVGSLQRRMFYGPGYINLDAAVLKEVRLFENHRMEFRAEAFNVTNTPSFYIGDITITSATFGRITSTQSGRRVLQFGLQYRF